jgi:hypothetical protein
VSPHGQSAAPAKGACLTRAWAALPASVKHIVVIRDVPLIHSDTLECVERAIARHRDAGTTCAIRRSSAIHRDPDVIAAERLHSRRVQVVDLTRFFCDREWCYPVVGGVLVFRDIYAHLTSVFATTLGPFLLEQVNGLMASWR